MIARAEALIARWLTPARARIYPATAMIVVLAGYVVSAAIGVGRTDAAGAIVGADFSAFYWAGTALREGNTHGLYDIDAEARFLSALIAPATNEHGEVHAFVSPPYWALVFAPLSALPYDAALAVFWLLSTALLILNVGLLRRALPALRAIPLRRAVLAAVAFFPVLFAFLDGQTSMIVLVPLVLAYAALRRERDFAAGLALGLLAIKPQLALGVVVILCGARRWRALSGAAISAGAWLAIGWTFLPDAMRDYAELAPELFEFLRRDDYYTWGQLSGYGFATMLLDPISHTAGTVGAYGAVLGLSVLNAWTWWRTPWTPGTRRWDLTMASSIAVGLVASPHLFLYDASLLLLSLAIVVAWLGSPGEIAPAGPLLDGGPVLAATGVLWIALFAGPYLTGALLELLRAAEIPAVVVQLPTLAILYWAWRVRGAADGVPSGRAVPDEASLTRGQRGRNQQSSAGA